MMNNYKYDVTLSFASEQRDYVEQVAKQLSSLGISFFYDNYETTNLWGKNLIKYLEKVYYQDSRYCVMFISREYSEKSWTRYECEAIEERNFSQIDKNDFQQYILPVRFDDTKIPGIKDSWGYISAQKTTPQELAQMIYEKIQDIELSFKESCCPLDLNHIYDELIKTLPKDFVVQNIRKSISNQKTDAILLFDNDSCFHNNFLCYDGKIFIDENQKLLILNLGYFEEKEILFEITSRKLMDTFLNKAKKLGYETI